MAYDSLLRRGYFSKFHFHHPCTRRLTPQPSSLLWCNSSRRDHRGRGSRNNHIVQQSDHLLLQLAISAWLTSRYASHRNFLSTTERDRVHFLLFCSIWTTVLSPIFPVLLVQELALLTTGIAAHVVLYVNFVIL
jgi:hypothetical protein